MRELTFDECIEITGGQSRFGWLRRVLGAIKDILTGAGSALATLSGRSSGACACIADDPQKIRLRPIFTWEYA